MSRSFSPLSILCNFLISTFSDRSCKNSPSHFTDLLIAWWLRSYGIQCQTFILGRTTIRSMKSMTHSETKSLLKLIIRDSRYRWSVNLIRFSSALCSNFLRNISVRNIRRVSAKKMSPTPVWADYFVCQIQMVISEAEPKHANPAVKQTKFKPFQICPTSYKSSKNVSSARTQWDAGDGSFQN